MPKFVLQIKAELEHVGRLDADPTNQWALLVQSPDASESCEAYVSRDEVLDLAGSKGTAHFIKKWAGSKQQAYLKIIDVRPEVVKGAYEAADAQEWVGMVAFEARGLEPVGWMPRGDFVVQSEGGTVFEPDAVEFDEGTWADYDAENDVPVSVTELQHRFQPC